MATESSKPGSQEIYCHSCGEVIKSKAKICPECGVENAADKSSEQKDSSDTLTPSVNESENYGAEYFLYDAMYSRTLKRSLLDLGLIVFTLHFWIYVPLAESAVHWACINSGKYEPCTPKEVGINGLIGGAFNWPDVDDMNYQRFSPLLNLFDNPDS
jgi:predicted RNA-binding Zn-ribbon protein involved in translation (DUF1610 family)